MAVDHYADAVQYLEDVDNGHANGAQDEQAYALLSIAHSLVKLIEPKESIKESDSFRKDIEYLKEQLEKAKAENAVLRQKLDLAEQKLAAREWRTPPQPYWPHTPSYPLPGTAPWRPNQVWCSTDGG